MSEILGFFKDNFERLLLRKTLRRFGTNPESPEHFKVTSTNTSHKIFRIPCKTMYNKINNSTKPYCPTLANSMRMNTSLTRLSDRDFLGNCECHWPRTFKASSHEDCVNDYFFLSLTQLHWMGMETSCHVTVTHCCHKCRCHWLTCCHATIRCVNFLSYKRVFDKGFWVTDYTPCKFACQFT